jgi:hypothetical protein
MLQSITTQLRARLTRLFYVLAPGAALLTHLFINSRAQSNSLSQDEHTGSFIAECWLEWEICTGSTMYRAAFKSEEAAAAAAKRHAALLDALLPTHYQAEFSSGRRYMEKYCFEIRWGVRPLTAHEKEHGVHTLWTTIMPGTRGHAGEHASAHPLSLDKPLRGSLQGYKV